MGSGTAPGSEPYPAGARRPGGPSELGRLPSEDGSALCRRFQQRIAHRTGLRATRDLDRAAENLVRDPTVRGQATEARFPWKWTRGRASPPRCGGRAVLAIALGS